MTTNRRSVLRAAGAAGAATLVPAAVAGASGPRVDRAIDTRAASPREILVVFDSNAAVDALSRFDLVDGYHGFEVLPVGYTRATGAQIREIAALPSVRYVEANRRLEWHNEDAREATGVERLHDSLSPTTGEFASVAVIDSGVDGDHPDLRRKLRANYRYVDPLSASGGALWQEVGDLDTDDNGHGTHTTGTVGGDGTRSRERYRGMAPDADLYVYSAGLTLAIVQAVAAYDHLLATHADEINVVSNSYGTASSDDFNPGGALETATWEAFSAGILPVFSAGNSGPELNTLNDYAKAPYVLSVAATDDGKRVTDFSSRGRARTHATGEGAQYDRTLALENVRSYHAAAFADEDVVHAATKSGTVGPGAEDAGAGEAAAVEWRAPPPSTDDRGVGYVAADISWTPPGQDLDVALRKGSPDGPVVGSAATLNNPEHLEAQVTPGVTYYFEVTPYANVAASFTVEITGYENPENPPKGPYGLYRNGLGAPGELVVSTLSPDDPLHAYAATAGPEEQDAEPWYGKLSGTSMSCPVVAGVAALVYDAHYRGTGGSYPSPEDVLTLLESTGHEGERDRYTAANIGAGFVDAVDAVRRGELGDVGDPAEVALAGDAFQLTGTRQDDGAAFYGGQTDEIVLSARSNEAVELRDRVPTEWTVLAAFSPDVDRVVVEDGVQSVYFESGVDEAHGVSYLVEAPEGVDRTGEYAFGPLEARRADGTDWLAVAGTADANVVVGDSPPSDAGVSAASGDGTIDPTLAADAASDDGGAGSGETDGTTAGLTETATAATDALDETV